MLAMTKQGVRDLGDSRSRNRVNMTLVNCEHRHMRWHCFIDGRPCGHLECPDCGEGYDIASDGPFVTPEGEVLYFWGDDDYRPPRFFLARRR